MEHLDSRVIRDAAEEVELLTRSDNRIHILNELYRHGQLHRDHLKETADVSRTTLQRNLDVLVERGWIHNSGVRYRITSCGELIAENVLDLVEAIDLAKRLRAVFRWIPPSELDADLHLLADATVWTPEAGDPYAMVNRHVELLEGMETERGLLRVAGLHAHEVAFEAVVEDGASGELVVTPDVAETLTAKPQYATLTERMVETGRFELFVHEGEVPFSLVIVDDRVQIGVDDGGEPRALLESASDEVREWAEETFAEYRRRATPLV